MTHYSFAGLFAAAVSVVLAATPAFSQTEGQAGTIRPSAAGDGRGAALGSGNDGAEPCARSPICAWGQGRNTIVHEERTPDLGFTFAYPFALPDGLTGGISAVAINSKGHLFAFQRNPIGKPQLFEFDQNHKLVRAIGDDVIGHQNKAHGIAIDAQDNVWICDENGDTVMKLSAEGKLLLTLGVRGQRGDWDEAKGQRLLWQPLAIAFAPNGDVYIGMGHANESPNDTGKSPANNIGAARVLRLDSNGKFINQWFGNKAGQGHFSMVHGIAVNPSNGNVYIGDREEYRIVVYDANGKFVKTIQMRNLVCALYVDPHGQLWMATGQDGQIFKIDWDGNVLGAIGNGPGKGQGQFTEATYMAMDANGNLYAGDTGYARITEMLAAPAQTAAQPAPDHPAVTVHGKTYTPRSILARNMGSGDDETTPFPPHKIIGNIYYVGTRSLSSFLIVTGQGNILIDSTYERNVRTIEKSVKQLGFQFSDIKVLLGSHAHGDHQEGDALVKELTGAQVIAMAEDVPALKAIKPGGKEHPIDRVVHDGESVTLGNATLVAHLTPGHTRGCTTWTMKVQDAGKVYNVVINCSLRPPVVLTPAIVNEFNRSFPLVRSLPCDVPLGDHPAQYNLSEKYAKLRAGGANPFIDPAGCTLEADIEEAMFHAILDEQQGTARSRPAQ